MVIDSLVDECVAWVSAGTSRRVLGLTGAPGAGKSTLAIDIVAGACARMGSGWAAYLPMDGFHLSNAQLARLGSHVRKGAPDTFDVGGFACLLGRVAADDGTALYAPDYDRELHEPIAARLVISPAARLVVTEGNYLALDAPGWREAREHIDQVWYVDAGDAVREAWLIARQIAAGLSEAGAIAWATGSDRANGEMVKATRARCDRTISLEP